MSLKLRRSRRGYGFGESPVVLIAQDGLDVTRIRSRRDDRDRALPASDDLLLAIDHFIELIFVATLIVYLYTRYLIARPDITSLHRQTR
jgi:hypothetical protein